MYYMQALHINACTDLSAMRQMYTKTIKKLNFLVLHKKISKKKSSSCRAGSVQNAQADKVHKQEVPCSQ